MNRISPSYRRCFAIMTLLPLAQGIFGFLLGSLLILWTLASVIRSFVLPRSSCDPVTRPLYRGLLMIFKLALRVT
jgi:hypothetical protein